MKHHDRKQLGEERTYWSYASTSLLSLKEVRDGTQEDRDLKAGADAEDMEG